LKKINLQLFASSEGESGFGTTLTIGGATIGELLGVTAPNRTRGSIEKTNLSSDDNYREFLPSVVKDGGEVSFRTNMYVSDSGQAALETAFEDGTTDTYVITFPTGIGASFTFSGFITALGVPEVSRDDGDTVQIEFTVKVSGKPTWGTSASTGASGIAMSNVTLAPVFAIGTFQYQGELANEHESFTVTVTAANHTIHMYVDGVFSAALTSASASSAISISAGACKFIKVTVWESAKTAKTYNIMVERAAA
jgi:hypothetical protein